MDTDKGENWKRESASLHLGSFGVDFSKRVKMRVEKVDLTGSPPTPVRITTEL